MKEFLIINITVLLLGGGSNISRAIREKDFSDLVAGVVGAGLGIWGMYILTTL